MAGSTSHCNIFNYRKDFRAALGLQQNSVEGTEISHVLPVPTTHV